MHLDAVEIDPVQRRGGAARVDKLNLSRLAIGHGFVTLRTDVRVALKAPPGGEGWVPRDVEGGGVRVEVRVVFGRSGIGGAARSGSPPAARMASSRSPPSNMRMI